MSTDPATIADELEKHLDEAKRVAQFVSHGMSGLYAFLGTNRAELLQILRDSERMRKAENERLKWKYVAAELPNDEGFYEVSVDADEGQDVCVAWFSESRGRWDRPGVYAWRVGPKPAALHPEPENANGKS